MKKRSLLKSISRYAGYGLVSCGRNELRLPLQGNYCQAGQVGGFDGGIDGCVEM